MVDSTTNCFTTFILGSRLTGECEDMKLLNQLLTITNKEIEWNTPFRVDIVSGRFVDTFLQRERKKGNIREVQRKK